MNWSLIKVLTGLALLASLGGCASMSKSECLNADWEDIGIRDGANGQPEEYLIQHSTACAKVHVRPDRERWLAGRERGLERFCTPPRVYRIGENGGGFDAGICRNFDQGRLSDAYQKGRDVNRASNAIDSIDNEVRQIHATLDDDDKQKDQDKKLGKKERDRLNFRLGVLVVERIGAQRAYDDAIYRSQNL